MSLSIQEMIKQLKTPQPMQIKEVYLPGSESPKKKREWKVADLGNDFSNENIVRQLSSDEYLHRSSKQIRLLFRILGKEMEEKYLAVQ